MKCKICNKERKTLNKECVCRYCVRKENNLKNGVAQKREETIIKKYGSLENFYKAKQNSRNENFVKKFGSVEAGKQEMRNKKEQTCLEHFGVTTGFNTKQSREKCVEALRKEETKEKRKATSLERYGDEFYNNRNKLKETLKNDPSIQQRVVEKGQATKLERYGSKTYVNPEKAKQTCLERYGCERYVQTNEFKSKMSSWYNSLTENEKLELKKSRHSKRWKYDDIYFDSFWEVEFYVFHKDHGHHIIYEPCALEYEVDGKLHRYYPDFEVDGELFELKSGRLLNEDKTDLKAPASEASKQNIYSAKFKCMKDNNVTLISNDEIKPFEAYIKYKYGNTLKKQSSLV